MYDPYNPDGSLRIVRWADTDEDALLVGDHPRARKMANSDASGEPILSNGFLGCDVIRFGPGEGAPPHTHEGNHILLVLRGWGRVLVEGKPYALEPGLAYFIEGSKVHSIEAETSLVLMAIGDQHRPVDSEARMALADA